MKVKDTTMVRFYRVLGELYYAIAAVDKEVRPQEIDTLKEIINDTWMTLEDSEDNFGADAAYQIEVVFDSLQENWLTFENPLDDLKGLKELHPSIFNSEINERILTSAEKIANAYKGKNNKESQYLKELRRILVN